MDGPDNYRNRGCELVSYFALTRAYYVEQHVRTWWRVGHPHVVGELLAVRGVLGTYGIPPPYDTNAYLPAVLIQSRVIEIGESGLDKPGTKCEESQLG